MQPFSEEVPSKFGQQQTPPHTPSLSNKQRDVFNALQPLLGGSRAEEPGWQRGSSRHSFPQTGTGSSRYCPGKPAKADGLGSLALLRKESEPQLNQNVTPGLLRRGWTQKLKPMDGSRAQKFLAAKIPVTAHLVTMTKGATHHFIQTLPGLKQLVLTKTLSIHPLTKFTFGMQLKAKELN